MKLRETYVRNFLLLLAPFLSALLLALAFPNYNQWLLAWIGLVPLHLAVLAVKPRYAFLLSLLCGFLFFASVFWWIFSVPGYKPLHHVILGLYLGLYFGVYGLVISYISRRLGDTPALVSSPFAWVALEYVRSNLSFLALPWALLAHSQYQELPVIQVASFAGAYGVSFLMVLVNAAITIVVAAFRKRTILGLLADHRRSAVSWLCFPVAGLVLLALALLYGQKGIMDSSNQGSIKASVIQGNITTEKQGDRKKYGEFVLGRYMDLTRKAAEGAPELVIWPEAATPGFILGNRYFMKQLMSLIKETGDYFLIGSSEVSKFQREPAGTVKVGNEALFFSPTGKVLGQYLKMHLVPFGEYIPLERTIKWPRFILSDDKTYYEVPGKEYTLFDLNQTRFGVVICWEHVFPDLFRTFVRKGADFIVNITNERWFGDTSAPYQMLAISVFRAVENRRAVARAANTGISCFIDPYGRITGRVHNGSKETFVEGYRTGQIPLCEVSTFYTRHGDVFAYGCLTVAAFLVVLCLFVPRKPHEH